MDIWEELYQAAKPYYHPTAVNDFIYTHNVVCALQSKSGKIYTGYCVEALSGVLNLCAERVALLQMYMDSGETEVQRLIAFRDTPPEGNGGMPSGACREAFMQYNQANKNMQIMVDYAKRETLTLGELMPHWWGTSVKPGSD